MVVTEHVTYCAGALAVVAVVSVAIDAHTVEDTTMHGLESVASIGQGTSYDNGHRIVEKRASHLAFDVYFDNSVF